MVALPSLNFSVKADLSGLKSVDRELTGLDTKGKSVGQSIGNALKSAANDAASSFRSAGGKSGNDFGDQFSRGEDGKVKDSFGRLVGSAKNAGGDAGKGFAGAFKGAIGNIFQGIAQGIGQQLTQGLGSAISGLKGIAIDREAIASYDKARAQVSTLTDDMAGMAAMAQKVSKDVGGSASQTEVLAASYDVLSAGFSEAADAANVLTAAQKGAIGGQSDLNTVSNATTTILNAYGLASKDAEKVVNQMIGTQNAGKIVVGEYANKIGAVATIAASAGVSLEELNAFIATATVKGVSANSSIDGMRAAISAVLKPSQEASEYAAALGVNFSAAGLKAGGLSGIMAQLKEKNADGAESLTKLFGSVEAVTAIMPSAGDGIKDFSKNLETIKSSSADDAFKKMENSIEGMSKKNAVLREELALKFQVATAPLFEAANQGLTTMLTSLNEGGVLFEGLNKAAASFRDFLAQNPEIITTITAAFTELLNGGILLLQDSIVGFTNALRENPQLIQQMVEGLAGGVESAIQFGQGMFTALTSIGQMLTPLAQLVGGMNGASEGANGMAGAFGQIVVYAAVFGPIVSALTSIVGLGTSIVGVFGGWVGIQAAISTGLATIAGWLGTILGAIPPIALALGAIFIWVENIKSYSANWNDVLIGVGQTWQDLTGWVSGIFEWIGQLVSRSEIFQGVWGAITGVIQFLIKPYKDIFDSVVNLVQKSEFFKGVWDSMMGVIDGIGKAFTSIVGGALDGLMQKAQGLWQAMQQMAGFGGGGAQGMNSGGGSGGGGSFSIQGLNDVQKKNVQAIVDEGKAQGLDENQIAAIVAGAMQESQLGTMNDEVGGYGGKGLFQLTDAEGQSGTWIGKGGIKSTQDYYDPNKNVKAIMEDYRFNEWKQSSKGQTPEQAATSFARIVLRPQEVGDKYADKARKLFPGGNASTQFTASSGGGFGGGIAGSAMSIANSFPGGGSSGGGADNKGNAGKVMVNRTGQKDEHGLEILAVQAFDKSGKNVGRFTANSGIRSTQGNFGQQARDVAGTNNPMPYGDYAIGDTVDAPNIPGYGKMTTIMDPKFATARAGIEAHVDGNRATSPGSAGCLVFKTEAEFAAFMASVRASGADTIRFEEAQVSGFGNLTQQFAGGSGAGNNSVGGGKIDNTVANAKAAKDAETQAMNAAVKAARDKEDAATRTKREDAARTLKQGREASKLKIEGNIAGLVTPEAKDAAQRELKQLEVRAQYEDRLLDLEQKRDDLIKARDRKKKDSASKDVGVAAAAKALPDFSAQIKSYDVLIAKDKELQATAIKNIGIGEDAKQAELDRTAAIANRNSALEKQIELQKSESQLALERATRTNPLLAAQIQFAMQRKDLQTAMNKELQDELDKLEEIDRKLAELAKVGQKDSPEIRRLEAAKNTSESRIANIKDINKNKTIGLDESQGSEMSRLKRERASTVLDKDSMMAEGGIQARRKTGARMREFGNVDGANKIEKESALTELTLSYRQKQLALEGRIADMRSKGVEVSEADAQSMRDQISALENADLSNLNRQFDTFQSEILPTIQSSLGGFFKTLMDGSKSVDEAFTDMIGNITNKIFEFAANQIVSSLLGGMFGGAGGGGFGGGIMKIFGMADGGIVAPQNNIAPVRARPDAIGAALRKEGSDSILAALTPGEMVLTTRQTSAFLGNPMASEILNFSTGGIVGRSGSPILQSSASNSGGGVNIALNVNNNGGEGVDYGMVAKVAQRAASSEISRQQKPRGSLSR